MVTKYVNQPLGMGICGAPSRKEWIASAIGAGVSVASSLFGGLFASSAAKEAEKKQRAMEAREQNWYNRRYNEDYTDTAAGQNLVRRVKDFARENWRKQQGAKAVGGGTDAATAMAKEAGNKMFGDTIANVAATDQANKSHVDDVHMKNQQNFMKMDMDRDLTIAQNITKAAQGASNAMMSIGSAVDQASAKAPNLNGGNNNSKVVDVPDKDVQVTTISSPHVAGADGVTAEDLAEKYELYGG